MEGNVLTENEVLKLWEDDDDLLDTNYLDSIMSYNAEEPSQNILFFNSAKGFTRDNTHRIISAKDLGEICPEAQVVYKNIEKLCKTNNTFLVFNKTIFISVESKEMSKSVNTTKSRKCYLDGCEHIIETGSSLSYLAVVWPPNGPFSQFPFPRDGQGRNGAICCKLHGLASQNTNMIYAANALYPQKLKVKFYFSKYTDNCCCRMTREWGWTRKSKDRRSWKNE